MFGLNIQLTKHGVPQKSTLWMEFFNSKDYQMMTEIGQEVRALIEEGAYIQRGDKKHPVQYFKQAWAWLMEEAKRGQQITRYKGLGEMNPDQLWSTTMDPSVRRLLQVTVEDAVAADQIFTCLMGDNVEPRREFIEANALNAINIDV